MKNIINTSKYSIIAILTFCILLGIAGTCLNVTAMAEKTTVVTEKTTQELMPRMATRCGTTNDQLTKYFGANYTVTATSGPWQYISGAGGITGGYNTSTGDGYVEMSDGSRVPFHISI